MHVLSQAGRTAGRLTVTRRIHVLSRAGWENEQANSDSVHARLEAVENGQANSDSAHARLEAVETGACTP